MADPAPKTLNPNDRLGPYVIQEFRAQGGMGAVYRARDPKLQRDVALKVLFPHLASDADFVARFQREAVSMAQLTHPNIVQVYDADIANGLPYLAMEYVPGETVFQTLKTLRARGILMPEHEALGIVRQIASALDYANKKGLVHRDVKPSNIMRAGEDRHVLTDFGIAFDTGATRLTRNISALGTPEYMSPEAGQGLPVDGRSDIYSLGIVLYELLSGKPPFSSDSALGTVYQHAHEPLPSIANIRGDLSKTTLRILDRATAKQPAQRFQTAGDFVRAIDVATGAAQDSQSIWASGPNTPARGTAARDATPAGGVAKLRPSNPPPQPSGGNIFGKLAAIVGALVLALAAFLMAAIFGVLRVPGLSPQPEATVNVGNISTQAVATSNANLAATAELANTIGTAQASGRATALASGQQTNASVQLTAAAIGTQAAMDSQSTMSLTMATQTALLAGLKATQVAGLPTTTPPATNAPTPDVAATQRARSTQDAANANANATAVAARATDAAKPTTTPTPTAAPPAAFTVQVLESRGGYENWAKATNACRPNSKDGAGLRFALNMILTNTGSTDLTNFNANFAVWSGNSVNMPGCPENLPASLKPGEQFGPVRVYAYLDSRAITSMFVGAKGAPFVRVCFNDVNVVPC